MRAVTHHVGAGLRTGASRPGLVVLQAAVSLLAGGLRLLVLLVLALMVLGRLLSGLAHLPFTLAPGRLLVTDAWDHLTAPGRLLPLVGLAAAAGVLGWAVRVLFVTGAAGRLAADLQGDRAPGRFMDAVTSRFAAAVGVGALGGAARLLAWGLSLGLLWGGLATWRVSAEPGGGGLALGAALAALALATVAVGAWLLGGALQLALLRAVVLGEPAGVAVFEGAALLMRRLGQVLLLLFLIGLAGLVVAVTVANATGLVRLVPAEAAPGLIFGASAAGVALRVLAAALVEVVGLSVLTSLILDDAGRLPAEPARPQAPRAPVPAEAIPVAVPIHGASGVVEAIPVGQRVLEAVPVSAPPGGTEPGPETSGQTAAESGAVGPEAPGETERSSAGEAGEGTERPPSGGEGEDDRSR